ncbi:hypothetical protein BST96_03535 [Oceanicoccus sagamiensis]|uniref:SPOR domain-containing protein n=1 Tax=Oceanicoccus sagamiensis TaxID=716816 RepID=A0A1X9NCK0_9GAMM|nr:hypothetical protein BST96_03535 [Oceanicoccus sagamiensis]
MTEKTKPPASQATALANDSYVVQLIAARNPETIERYKQQHPQLSPQLLTIDKNGEAWQVLILGTFSSYQAAQAAVAAITPPLSSQPWIRPIAPIRQALEAQ